jgi:alpha-glucuronidase
VLHSGKTVIQHIYDAHYEGASDADAFVSRWASLEGLVDERRFREVLDSLEYQAGHAVVWRDAVCSWFLRMSGIADAKGRAGHFPGRVEAEAMRLDGYTPVDVTPWETASGGKAVRAGGAGPCSAAFGFEGRAGRYDVDVEYFDLNEGASRFRLVVGGRVVDEWVASATLPSAKLDGHTSTRRRARGIALRPGDEVRVEATPDPREGAPLDYVELVPAVRPR